MYGHRLRGAVELPKEDMRKLTSLFAFLRPYRTLLISGIVATICSTAMILALGGAIRYVVDSVLKTRDTVLVDDAFKLLIAVILLYGVLSFIRVNLVAGLSERVVKDIRIALYNRLIHMHICYYDSARTGELLSRITLDSAIAQAVLTSTLPVALRNIMLFIGGFTLLLLTSPKLSAYVILIVPAVVVPLVVLGRKLRQLANKTQKSVAELNAHAEESLNAVRTLQSMTMEGVSKEKFTHHTNIVLGISLRRIFTRALMIGLVVALVFGSVAVIMWIGTHDVLLGKISAGELASFMFYAMIVAGAVGGASDVFADLQRAAGVTDNIRQLLGMESEITSPEYPVMLPECRDAVIEFHNVDFYYPTRPEYEVLKGASFQIQPGEMVALVGPSGAGKTTLLQLLMRYYDPQKGGIILGGVNIRDVDLQAYRERIGVVPQEPFIFSTTAMENIRCGKPDATDEEIYAAAKAARAAEFIEAMPQGYETYLGEKGVRLSGGQRQRIAIARALVRDPGILLLDEATSSLDAENEHLVQQALHTLMKGRSTLVIAHRLSTVKNANRIVVMEAGEVVDIGTHDELIARNPVYHRYFQLQTLKEA